MLSYGQQDSFNTVYNQMKDFYFKGEYLKSIDSFESILKFQVFSPEADLRLIYHYAGLIYTKLDDPEKALRYYQLSAEHCASPEINPYHLFHNFNSLGHLNEKLGDNFRARAYLEQALNYLGYVNKKDRYYHIRLSAVMFNLGLISYKTGDYHAARAKYLECLKINLKENLPNTSNIYMNLAKVADRLEEFPLAENYYHMAINTKIEETNDKHPEVADIYTEYGEMLMLVGRYEESLSYLEKALFLFIDIYGIFSTYTTACYQIIGDLYLAQDSCLQSFEYYQKALQSIYPGFVSDEFYDNPSEEGSLRDIRYLEILDKKSYALSKYAIASKEDNSQMDLLEYSLNTTALALKVKEKIRNSYPSQESILFLAEHEKSIYLNGINAAYDLFILSGDSDYSKTAYGFASEWKASELLRKINSREALNNENINDSLYSALNINEQRISQYKNSIFQENQKEVPDSINLFRLKDDLFEASRNYEQDLEIARTQDWYKRMHPKPEPADIAELQRHLSANQSIIEYVLSPRDSVKQNQLYTFVITRNDFKIIRQNVGVEFYTNLDYYLYQLETFPDREISISSFDSLSNSLYNLYSYLIEPVEKFFNGNELFIIPDERLNILPFESLISLKTKEGLVNFSGLSYLVHQYNISYAYSVNLLFRERKYKIRKISINAFAPAIDNLFSLETEGLSGAKRELEYISTLFNGNYYYGKEASLSNFYSSISDPGIFHFAMHSNRERNFESGGYLEFYEDADDSLSGKLWGHEISFLELESPMVCLSACNSGLGVINRSEGILSLTRNFMEAGAASVVNSLWEVNDFTGFDVITGFYTELFKGKKKNSALQKAKLKFLDKASPALHHPFYWSGYQLVGSIDPVKSKFFIIPGGLTLILSIGLIYSLRRRISRRRLSADV